MRWNDFYGYPRARPRRAKGGIRAQSLRGRFGQTWWARRWIAVLEGFQSGSRLQRGRAYARSGQVLALVVAKGAIEARVLGSRPKPYDVHIGVKQLSPLEWKRVAEAVSRQAIFGAKLLAGEMPQEIETAFLEAGVSLFPERGVDLKTQCSCPDTTNPCKHIAAVYYLAGEEFDRDPFLIFEMRGMERERFLGLLGGPAAPAAVHAVQAERLPEQALPSSPAAFWKAGDAPRGLLSPPQTAAAPAALPKRLGNFPFWRGRERFLDIMESAYEAAGAAAARILSES